MERDLMKKTYGPFYFLLTIFLMINCAMLLCSRPVASAQPNLTQAKIDKKIVTGTILAIRQDRINVEYDKKDGVVYEMILPLADMVQYSHVRSLSDLNAGDEVKVKYEQTYEDQENGERKILKTEAIQITLVKRATVEERQPFLDRPVMKYIPPPVEEKKESQSVEPILRSGSEGPIRKGKSLISR